MFRFGDITVIKEVRKTSAVLAGTRRIVRQAFLEITIASYYFCKEDIFIQLAPLLIIVIVDYNY